MLTYDPNLSNLISDIPEPAEMTVDEELAREALTRTKGEQTKTVPSGLLKNYQPEKKVDESQMADFSTPIEDVMAGPGQMMQNEIMGSPFAAPQQAQPAARKRSADGEPAKGSKNPFGLTDEQFQAALAGVAAVIAYSKPVQSRRELPTTASAPSAPSAPPGAPPGTLGALESWSFSTAGGFSDSYSSWDGKPTSTDQLYYTSIGGTPAPGAPEPTTKQSYDGDKQGRNGDLASRMENLKKERELEFKGPTRQ
jgi:hypothetical protein